MKGFACEHVSSTLLESAPPLSRGNELPQRCVVRRPGDFRRRGPERCREVDDVCRRCSGSPRSRTVASSNGTYGYVPQQPGQLDFGLRLDVVLMGAYRRLRPFRPVPRARQASSRRSSAWVSRPRPEAVRALVARAACPARAGAAEDGRSSSCEALCRRRRRFGSDHPRGALTAGARRPGSRDGDARLHRPGIDGRAALHRITAFDPRAKLAPRCRVGATGVAHPARRCGTHAIDEGSHHDHDHSHA